ncbi:MAG: hypothetical protein WKF61_09560 [Luteimonas sp.]
MALAARVGVDQEFAAHVERFARRHADAETARRDTQQPAGKRGRFAQFWQALQRGLEDILGQVLGIGMLHIAQQHAMHHAREPRIQRPHGRLIAAARCQHQHRCRPAFVHVGSLPVVVKDAPGRPSVNKISGDGALAFLQERTCAR